MKPSSVSQINGRSDNKLPKIQEKKNEIADSDENTKNTSAKWKKILIYSTILVLISVSCHFILKNENIFNINIENILSKIFKCVSIEKFKVVYISLADKVIDIQNRLCKTIGRDYIEVLFKLKLMLINLKYGLNIALSNVRYQYKRIARKYQIIILFQAIIYRLLKFVINLIMLIRGRVMDIIVESSNSSFYFYLFVVLLVLVLFWDNVVMREYCNDFRVKNFKIITSTISTLITVFYFPVIERILFILVELVFNNIYSFCSKAYLGINESEKILNSGYYSYNHDDVVEFSIISKNWWRSRKLDSVFKGVELINEVKKRYGEKKSNLGVLNTIKEIGIASYINNGSKISKEFCNTVLNGNLNVRVGLRVTTLLMGTLSTLLILNKEKRKFNQNRGERVYSKAYLMLIVISGIFIPILINNIQKISNYSDQGKVISILLFLTFKIVTNYNHFLSLIMIIIDDLKSRLKNKNDIERIFTLNNNILNESNLYFTGMTEKNIKNKVGEGNVTKFPEVKEVSSLFKEKNRKASLVLKTNTNYKSSRTNPKYNTNSRSCLNRESSNNLIKIGKVNEVLRKNIASKVGVEEELGENSDLREIRNEKSAIKTINNIINKIINLLKSLFLNSLVNTFLYISNGNYRGKVLSPMDHYKLNKYINKSKISINIIEELLKSMTLCYTNIGNRTIIKLITIKKTELIDELNNFKQILPESEILSKLSLYKGNNNYYNYNELSKLEKIIYPFSLTLSLEDKINVQVNYYMLLNSIEILTCNCETIKISCRAIINSECLIELINNISNNDLDKITRLLSSKMDYKTISDILISSIFAINNKSNILNKFSLVNNSYNRVNHELVENLSRLNNVDTKEIFTQWNILRSGLKVILHEIKENRRSYEDAYMGGLPLHTLQMSLHYLNTLARKTSDLVQESIIACSEFCLYFNLKTLDELNELNSTSSGQLKLFDLCIKDCKDILNLIKTIKNVMIDICDQKLRIEGKEMDISYLSSLLPSMISNNDHKCCRKENESSCKLHGKGLKDTYKLYSEGNCPAVVEIGVNNSIINSDNEKTEKFVPERPKSSIPRESSTRRNNHEQKLYDDDNPSPSLQTSLRRPASINSRSNEDSNTNNNLKNTDNLPFLIETPGEKQNIQQM